MACVPQDAKIMAIEHVFVEVSRSCNFCGSYYIPLFNNELFLSAFVVIKKRRTIFLFQYTVIQSFGVCLQINCLQVSIKRPKHFIFRLVSFFFNWDSLVPAGLGILIFHKMSPAGLTITICNKVTVNLA